ncbi:MAG: hypothetical protein KJ957_06255 [Candidatus Omnitrophica bacterium]|nr:hypothetical protein [Candidatus Omnitrophota bacterium]
MQYIELHKALKDFTVFSLWDIKSLDAAFYRRRLNEWQDRGYIKKLIKGYYVFSDLEINENLLCEIANRIYIPSYISFETALSYYGLIPESVYGITSVSTRRTYKFKTHIAQFSYRSIAPRLFFGYEIVRYNSKCFKIASAEKAFLDYFYINTHIKTSTDFHSLRIDKNNFFKKVNKKKFDAFLGRFAQKKLTKRMHIFWETIKDA